MRLDPIAMQRNKEESPAETLRARWADMVNKAYVESGVAEHVDHRSYARRGISKISTVHEGVWHHAPCPVNHPAELNASIRLCNLARQKEKQQAKQQEAIRKEHQKARQAPPQVVKFNIERLYIFTQCCQYLYGNILPFESNFIR